MAIFANGERSTELTTDSQPSGKCIASVLRCSGKRSVLCARSTVCIERGVAEGADQVLEAKAVINSINLQPQSCGKHYAHRCDHAQER